jgi:hypothetical protein
MAAVPVSKCQPAQSRVMLYQQQAAVAGGAQAKSFDHHLPSTANPVQIATPTSESNSLISALAFENAPSSATPWGNNVGAFSTSPTVSLPMNAGWFALAQVPVPTPVLSGNIVKSEPDQGQSKRLASPDASRADAIAAGEKGAKRPKIEIPEEGFLQVSRRNHSAFTSALNKTSVACFCAGIQGEGGSGGIGGGGGGQRGVAAAVDAGQQRQPQGAEPAEPRRRLPRQHGGKRGGAANVLLDAHLDQLAAALLLVAGARVPVVGRPPPRRRRRRRHLVRREHAGGLHAGLDWSGSSRQGLRLKTRACVLL